MVSIHGGFYLIPHVWCISKWIIKRDRHDRCIRAVAVSVIRLHASHTPGEYNDLACMRRAKHTQKDMFSVSVDVIRIFDGDSNPTIILLASQ